MRDLYEIAAAIAALRLGPYSAPMIHFFENSETLLDDSMGFPVLHLGDEADAARILLDDLTERYPDWAEAWNRRATLCFIEKRDADCLADIERTLALEPRHFGAISDFGHVCLRHGHLNEARAAFQIALSINPHLEDLGEILEDLAPRNLMLH